MRLCALATLSGDTPTTNPGVRSSNLGEIRNAILRYLNIWSVFLRFGPRDKSRDRRRGIGAALAIVRYRDALRSKGVSGAVTHRKLGSATDQIGWCGRT
jgi:hypothetical protein